MIYMMMILAILVIAYKKLNVIKPIMVANLRFDCLVPLILHGAIRIQAPQPFPWFASNNSSLVDFGTCARLVL